MKRAFPRDSVGKPDFAFMADLHGGAATDHEPGMAALLSLDEAMVRSILTFVPAPSLFQFKSASSTACAMVADEVVWHEICDALEYRQLSMRPRGFKPWPELYLHHSCANCANPGW